MCGRIFNRSLGWGRPPYAEYLALLVPSYLPVLPSLIPGPNTLARNSLVLLGGVALVENLFGMILEFLLSPRSYLLSYSCLIGHLFAKFLLQAPLGLGPVSRTWQMVRGKEQVLMAWQTRPQMRGGSRPGTLVRGALLLCDLQTCGRRGKIVILVPPWAFPLLSGEEI